MKILENIKNSRLYDILKSFYYDIRYMIFNQFKYFKIVSKMREWDYEYILQMMKFQLEILCDCIEKYGNEINESRIPKIEKMKYAIELLNNLIEQNQLERCGYIADAVELKRENNRLKFVKNPKYSDYNEKEVFNKSLELEEKEWNELFNILKTDMRFWWD
jgi:hypothetical protein